MARGPNDEIAAQPSPRPGRGLFLGALAIAFAFTGGCRTPDAANITLRKENQKLKEQVTKLERLNAGRTAPVVPTTGPTIDPAARQYGHLFTAHGLKLESVHVDRDLNYSTPPVEGLKIHLQPTDQDGDVIKAAGSITVDVFDLQQTGPTGQRIGHWEFPVSEAAKNWYGSRLVYAYVLRCPWPHGKRPAHSPLTVRVTFVDELTRRQFAAQGTVNVPTATTAPVNVATSQP